MKKVNCLYTLESSENIEQRNALVLIYICTLNDNKVFYLLINGEKSHKLYSKCESPRWTCFVELKILVRCYDATKLLSES